MTLTPEQIDHITIGPASSDIVTITFLDFKALSKQAKDLATLVEFINGKVKRVAIQEKGENKADFRERVQIWEAHNCLLDIILNFISNLEGGE